MTSGGEMPWRRHRRRKADSSSLRVRSTSTPDSIRSPRTSAWRTIRLSPSGRGNSPQVVDRGDSASSPGCACRLVIAVAVKLLERWTAIPGLRRLPPSPGTEISTPGWCVRKKAPQRGCAPVAEDGGLAAGKHRRHPPAFVAEPGMADRVNAAMDTMQASRPPVSPNRRFAQSGVAELANRDDAVLLRCHGGDCCVWCGAFLPHGGGKAPRPPIRPRRWARVARRARGPRSTSPTSSGSPPRSSSRACSAISPAAPGTRRRCATTSPPGGRWQLRPRMLAGSTRVERRHASCSAGELSMPILVAPVAFQRHGRSRG